MAIEYIVMNDADGTPRQIAADLIGTLFVQVLKMGFAADGSLPTLVSAADPLPVVNTAGNTTLASILTELAQKLEPADLAALATAAKQDAAKAVLDAIAAALAGTLTTAPTSAGDVAGTLTNGRKTITSTGTPEAIRGTLACKWVEVTALKTNTQDIYAGGSGVTADAGSETGTPLEPGATTTIPVNDAAKVFVDVRVNGEGVTFVVGS